MSSPNDPRPQDRPPHDQPAQGYGQPAAPGYGDQPAQGGYGQPAAQGGYGAPEPKNGIGIAAVVTAVIALLLSWVPFLGGLVALAGIVLGFVARGRVKRGEATNPGMALIALILSVVALLINIAIVLGGIFLFSQVEDCAALPTSEQEACIEEQLNS
jgi:hypothetical protein